MKKEYDSQTEVGFPVAESFEALAEVALKNLNGERGFHMVCGPITTGGTGDPSANLEILIAVIHGLKKSGKRVFDQTPYEDGLHYLADNMATDGYCFPILDIFYKTLFDHGVVAEAWFIPGWESSVGTRWEHKTLTRKNVLLHELERSKVYEYLLLNHSEEEAKLLAESLFVS